MEGNSKRQNENEGTQQTSPEFDYQEKRRNINMLTTCDRCFEEEVVGWSG